jgi:GNAT superfamily N-acetyltransferase
MGIRPFEEKDRESLREVYLQVRKRSFNWLDSGSLELSDFDKDTQDEVIWVCVHREMVVGFISAQIAGKFIHHLYVSPKYSKRGYGSKLLDACLGKIGHPAQLKCVSENTEALRFYQSKGWHTLSKAIGIDGEYHLMEQTEHNN